MENFETLVKDWKERFDRLPKTSKAQADTKVQKVEAQKTGGKRELNTSAIRKLGLLENLIKQK